MPSSSRQTATPNRRAASVLGIFTSVGGSRRLQTVVEAALAATQEVDANAQHTVLDVKSLGLPFADGRSAEEYDGAAAELIQAVETADALVVGTGAYRATFSGALKNVLEIVPPEAVAGKPVAIVVTGGMRDHYLVADYALRPVLVHMGAQVVTQTVYADPSVMPDGAVGPELQMELVRSAEALMASLELSTRPGRTA